MYYQCLRWIFTVIGCWKVLQLLLPLARTARARLLGLEYKWSSLGRWAVVTGGTDGIGKAYAEQLASRGFNICIISRNVEKLRTVVKEIAEKHRVFTCTIHADFTDSPGIYPAIGSELDALPGGIGVLVNNVGMSYRNAEYFHLIEGGERVIRDLISTNVTACTMMMHLVLPRMLDHGKGVIVNVSSLTAIYPMPLLTVYAACKAYVDHLSRAVHYEYLDRGICVQGFVHEWLKAHMPASVNLAISMYYMKKAREGYFRKVRRRMQREKEDGGESHSRVSNEEC